jgi:Na+-transporting methylmalonyl-CoA/oxaloacetate decarboxylase gamma subunit
MNHALTSSLWITLIGMGLVFIALFLLWGLMELMVRLTARHAEGELAELAESSPAQEEPAETPDLVVLRHRAAAAAVALALAMNQEDDYNQPEVMGAPLSGWQPVLRSNQLNQHSNMYSRKPRGSSQ